MVNPPLQMIHDKSHKPHLKLANYPRQARNDEILILVEIIVVESVTARHYKKVSKCNLTLLIKDQGEVSTTCHTVQPRSIRYRVQSFRLYKSGFSFSVHPSP